MMENSWLEGQISVEAALTANNRKIHAIYIQQGKWNKGVRQLMKRAAAGEIPVKQVDRAFIDAKSGGKSHGGIVAKVGERRFQTLADLIMDDVVPFLVMLDGIEDPFNFGQAIRALYAAGVGGVVVRPRNWMSAAGVVVRASAGASELMPTAVAETAETAAEFYREQGLTVACTSDEQAVSLYAAGAALKRPLFLLIGGEKRGITRSFMEQADIRLQIPYGERNGRLMFKHSLGAAAAAAVIAFEIMRVRADNASAIKRRSGK